MIPPANTSSEQNKWQSEFLMEKLRSKASQYKSLTEMSKAVRMALLDKRFAVDSVEKSQHQKCLDMLQHSIKVTSLQSMVERLESLTRQLELKFTVGPSGVEVFISSDMFYLEIVLDSNGAVKDVEINHEGKMERQKCSELVACLSSGNFDDFTAQLEGLAAIYQINADKKVKCKAFCALQSLEADLSTLAQLQSFIKEPFDLVHKSSVGLLEKRKGGHPMKLTFFVSPYDLIDKEKKIAEPLTTDIVITKNIGCSAAVCIESSTPHKLQTTSIISVSRNMNGKNTPSYAPLGTQNSALLPACFCFKFDKPMPIAVALLKKIEAITEVQFNELPPPKPLLSLIISHHTNGQIENNINKGLFVTLPDQHHCYFMTENKNLTGVLVNSVPFSHPAHVPQILSLLRQQALFNAVITSCIRPLSKQDIESMIMVEVNPLSWQHISISLEHPTAENMTTAEIDLSDIGNVICSVPAEADTVSELTSKVLQKSLSLPITMRALINCLRESNNSNYGHENFSLALGPVDPGGSKGHEPPGLGDFQDFIKQENSQNQLMTSSNSSGSTTQMNTDSMSTMPSSIAIIDKLSKQEDTGKTSGKSSPSTHFLFECDRNSVSPSVSITPINASSSSMVSSIEKRPGIEIIPLSTSTGGNSSNASSNNSGNSSNNTSSNNNSNTSTPNSISTNSLSSSITITPIKSSDDRNRDKKVSKSRSDEKLRLEKKRKRKREDESTSSPSEKSHKQDPLNKPVSVSIKPTESSSGKPSLSALKSSSELIKIKSKDFSSPRDKDKKSPVPSSPSKSKSSSSSSSSSSSKTKSSEFTDVTAMTTDNVCSPSSDANKSSPSSQARNRKGSLSAVIDKLKSAQHSGEVDISKINSADPKNSEYMVKHSSDGMKITINKTRTKESSSKSSSGSSSKSSSSSSSSSSSNNNSSSSTKPHTGLKPGVNSGPASKKSLLSHKSFSNNAKISSSSSSSSSKLSSPNSKSKSSSSSSSSSDKSKEKSRSSSSSGSSSSKSSSEKSIFSSKDSRKSSPTPRDESDSTKSSSKSVIDPMLGITKTLDTKFQIPKVSSKSSNSSSSDIDTKKSSKLDAPSNTKYPVACVYVGPNNKAENEKYNTSSSSMPSNSGSTLQNVNNISPSAATLGLAISNETSSKDLKIPSDSAKFLAPSETPYKQQTTTTELTAAEIGTSLSPSVSVHIVSPSIQPPISPHSASPCITDDELMDEALVGLGK